MAALTPEHICLVPDWLLLPYAVHAYQTGLRTSTVGPIICTRSEQRAIEAYDQERFRLAGRRGYGEGISWCRSRQKPTAWTGRPLTA